MYNPGLLTLIIKVVSSWQIIVTIIFLVLYFKIVFYAAHSGGRPGKSKPKKTKTRAVVNAEPEITEEANTDDLGLEE